MDNSNELELINFNNNHELELLNLVRSYYNEKKYKLASDILIKGLNLGINFDFYILQELADYIYPGYSDKAKVYRLSSGKIVFKELESMRKDIIKLFNDNKITCETHKHKPYVVAETTYIFVCSCCKPLDDIVRKTLEKLFVKADRQEAINEINSGKIEISRYEFIYVINNKLKLLIKNQKIDKAIEILDNIFDKYYTYDIEILAALAMRYKEVGDINKEIAIRERVCNIALDNISKKVFSTNQDKLLTAADLLLLSIVYLNTNGKIRAVETLKKAKELLLDIDWIIDIEKMEKMEKMCYIGPKDQEKQALEQIKMNKKMHVDSELNQYNFINKASNDQDIFYLYCPQKIVDPDLL